MTQEIQKKNTQNSVVKLPIVPKWINQLINDKKPARYSAEGQSDLVIAAHPVRLSDDQYRQAKAYLEELQRIYAIKVSFSQIEDIFKVVNATIANTLDQERFNFKIKALYGIFCDYPAVLFNLPTCKKIANISRFFPSGNEIEAILEVKNAALKKRISDLQALLRESDETSEQYREAERAKAAEKQRQEEEYERRRIERWKNLFLPIDPLYEKYKSLIGNFIQGKCSGKKLEEIISDMESDLPKITCPEVKSIFESELENFRKALAMVKQLEKLSTNPTELKECAA